MENGNYLFKSILFFKQIFLPHFKSHFARLYFKRKMFLNPEKIIAEEAKASVTDT